MNASKTVTATFQPEFTLTVTPSGNATGTVTGTNINCGADCSETYLAGTVVTLTRSTPATGTSFQWLGDCAFRSTNSTCVLTMNQNHSVGAQFQLQQFTVTVNKTGTAPGPRARARRSLRPRPGHVLGHASTTAPRWSSRPT